MVCAVNQPSDLVWQISSEEYTALITYDEKNSTLKCNSDWISFEVHVEANSASDVEDFILRIYGDALLSILLGEPTEVDFEGTYAHLRNAVASEKNEKKYPLTGYSPAFCLGIIDHWESRDFSDVEEFLCDGWADIEDALDATSLRLQMVPSSEEIEQIDEFFAFPIILYQYEEEMIKFSESLWPALQDYIKLSRTTGDDSHWLPGMIKLG